MSFYHGYFLFYFYFYFLFFWWGAFSFGCQDFWIKISCNGAFLWISWWLTNFGMVIFSRGYFCLLWRAWVVFSYWSKVGMCCCQTLGILSMMPVSRPFFKLFGIMLPLNIRIFNYLWHYLNGFGIPPVLFIFRVLVKWC